MTMGIRYIYQYELDPGTGVQHAIPEGAVLFDVGVQDNVPVMWWSVPAGELEDPSKWPLRTFLIAPTGGPGYTANLYYVGTFQLELPGGRFVGHILTDKPVIRAR